MRFVLALLFFTAPFLSLDSFCQKREIVVVIDPGHGGYDPGHLSEINGYLTEKELNLKISKFLGEYIEKYLQNVRVIYTRTSDVYPTLEERVNKANHNNADYFMSIHCNGNERKAIHGTESHVHSFTLKRSVAFAEEMERQFSARAGRKSRGVKDQSDLQHSLQVLKFTNMPGILIECGFLTNDKEAAFLNTAYGQEIIASAIFRGFRETIEKEHPTIAFRRSAPIQNSDVASLTSISGSESYCIQIMSSKEPVDTEDEAFKRLKIPVQRKALNTTGVYKYIYTVGDYGTKKEARDELELVHSRGYKDAIIIKR